MPTEAEIVARHAATEAPTEAIPKPPMGDDFQLDPAIIDGMSSSLQLPQLPVSTTNTAVDQLYR